MEIDFKDLTVKWIELKKDLVVNLINCKKIKVTRIQPTNTLVNIIINGKTLSYHKNASPGDKNYWVLDEDFDSENDKICIITTNIDDKDKTVSIYIEKQ